MVYSSAGSGPSYPQFNSEKVGKVPTGTAHTEFVAAHVSVLRSEPTSRPNADRLLWRAIAEVAPRRCTRRTASALNSSLGPFRFACLAACTSSSGRKAT
jgi:hypothetical protein